MIEIGTVLQGRFLIEEQIGVGGMGAVYRATDQKFGSFVAIKETFYRDKDLAEAFEREARLLNGLHHPLFPHVSDHFTEGEGHFLVMEFIEGQDLSELLKRGERFPFERVMGWTLDLLDGLDYLHSQDPPVIHRDIKPNNLKLTSRGNIVLLDFGMAKETSGNTQGMRSVFGYSRRYSPLEQIEGTGTDVRSDIFSLGATVYHVLTGTPPIDVLRRASTIVAGRLDPLELASSLNPEVPERIAALLNSALALNPDMRFASARAMWSALENSLDGHQPVTYAGPVSPATVAPVLAAEPLEDVRDESFPAFDAYEAGKAERSKGREPGSDIQAMREIRDEPDAELASFWETRTKAEEPHAPSERSSGPARIEVPVGAGSRHASYNVTGGDRPDERSRKGILASAPILLPVAVRNWRTSPLLLAIPVLLLVLGLLGYALSRGEDAVENTVEKAPAAQAVSPEASPAEVVASEPTAEVVPSENTVALSEETGVSPVEEPTVEDSSSPRIPSRQRAETEAPERVRENMPIASEPRSDARGREQARNRPAPNNRTNGITRPRIAEDRVFEQPPIFSIESIMTGTPAGRPRGQNNWEVLEDDEMKRLRRFRRIERRSRQRWPLF